MSSHLTTISTEAVLRAASLVNQTQSLLAMDMAMELQKGMTMMVELKAGRGANPTIFVAAEDLELWVTAKVTSNLEELEALGVDTSVLLDNYKQLAESIKARQQSGTPLDNASGV